MGPSTAEEQGAEAGGDIQEEGDISEMNQNLCRGLSPKAMIAYMFLSAKWPAILTIDYTDLPVLNRLPHTIQKK